MSLIPTPSERLARAMTDLRLGLPVVLRQPGGAALVSAAEGTTDARLSDLQKIGVPVLAITSHRAETLNARVYDGDIARITLPNDATASWVRMTVDPKDDLQAPLKGPFQSPRNGDPYLHRLAVRMAKAAHLLPAALVTLSGQAEFGDLTQIDAEQVEALLDAPPQHKNVVSGRVPIRVAQSGRVHVFRPDTAGEEHYVCEIGSPPRDAPVLARLHSACFTGDVLGSLKCDCGPQLQAALAQMGAEGAGLLLYLNQEGRGIGLANKMRAYSLQDQGFDTVEANHRLGFEDDERDFRAGADILKQLGFKAVRLMTNNPAKVAMMQAQGISVTERVPLQVGRGPLNEAYLETKAKKSGHIL